MMINNQDTVSLLRTADNALDAIAEILKRMRVLAVQSASCTDEDKVDREALQSEFLRLQKEIDDISITTAYDLTNLLDGSHAVSEPELDITRLNK